jgi:hypothetical protein
MEVLIDGEGCIWDAEGEDVDTAVRRLGQVYLECSDVCEVLVWLDPSRASMIAVAAIIRIIATSFERVRFRSVVDGVEAEEVLGSRAARQKIEESAKVYSR